MSAAAPSVTRSRQHGLYVHVPFCRLVCAYCDFVTVAGRRTDIPRYVDALLAEMAARPADGTLGSIYFGGGTPSLLAPSHVDALVRAAVARWRGQPGEVTLEANPSVRERPSWSALRAAGVTRLSLGVQSLRDADLRALGRGHTAVEARDAYRTARAAGFDNVSLDLIYDVPGQSLADWRAGLSAAIALEPDHVSLYGLSLALSPDEWASPPRTGALRWRRRAAAGQDEDRAADQYRLAEELLGAAGFRHYELSSWARPGRESVHNLGYWTRRGYTGLGAGAHSFDGRRRSWNERGLDAYLAAVADHGSATAGEEVLARDDEAFEAVALGLRLVAGMSRSEFRAAHGEDPATRYADAVARASAGGLIEVDMDRIRLTAAGRLLANEALVEFASAG